MTAESQLLRTINQFIGPCAHGSDPYDRCEECEWLSPIEAKVVALKAEVERLRDEVALLKRHLSGAWQDRDRAEAALKEGDR